MASRKVSSTELRARKSHVRQRIVERFDARFAYEDVRTEIQKEAFAWVRKLTGTKSMIRVVIGGLDVYVVVTRQDMSIHTVLDTFEHANY